MSEDRIIIFDTTLRDGEQAPGASMSIEQKVEIAKALAKMKVDVMEAGFPVSSEAQFKACETIAKEVSGITVAALARSVKGDIDAAYDSIKHAQSARIHTFIATSDIHIKHKLKKTHDEVLEAAVNAVKYAKAKDSKISVQFSAEDASRSNPDFLVKVFEAVIEAGADTVNIPDTVGYSTPQEYTEIIRYVKENTPNIDKALISVHCHDDLGLAAANTLSSIAGGARQLECTVNGIGERAGNAPLEEVVMALKVRKDFFGFDTEIKTDEIHRISKMVSAFSGFSIQPNKAIVGKNAFRHESGIHQDGVLKARETYEIMKAEDIGLEKTGLAMGRHSGRHGFSDKMKSLGFDLEKEKLDTLYARFLKVADKKKEIYDEDIIAIIEDEFNVTSNYYMLDYVHAVSGSGLIPSATVRIKHNDEEFFGSAYGDGPVDAACKAIDNIVDGISAVKLLDFEIQSATFGKDALGEVCISIEADGKTYSGFGASTDIIEASAKAYINAINKYLRVKEGK